MKIIAPVVLLGLIAFVSEIFYPSTPSHTQSIFPEEGKKTNIILLMGDDHGWEETGYNQHPFILTPVLDEMVKNGLTLNRFYSAHPSCSPTRGSILTGRHPNRYGTFTPGYSIRPDEISIAQVIKERGYATAHFGKWHLGPVKEGSPTNPGAMGFDTWLSHDNFFEMNPILSRNGAAPKKIEGEGSEIVIDEAISFIRDSKKNDQPFFAVIWFGSPHEPYQAKPEDLVLYSNLPDTLKDKYVNLTSLKTGRRVSRSLDSVLQERYAEITAMDRSIGKLRDYLDKEGIKDHTLIWYCGDNGIPSSGLYNSSLNGLKGTVYEGGVRVPGIIEWPERISKPRVSEVNSVSTDIFSTLCEIVGVELPNRPIDGLSLMPVIRGEVKERSNPICFWNFHTQHLKNNEPYIDLELQKGTTPLVKMLAGQFTRTFRNYHHREISKKDYLGDRAILDNRYKLVIGYQGEEEAKELYDILADPGETQNLIQDKPKIANKLNKQLRTWQKSVLKSLMEQDYTK